MSTIEPTNTSEISVADADADDKVQEEELETPVQAPVIKEINSEPRVGEVTGQCKWFNDNLGFGFLTIQNGDNKGADVFVHHTGIKPLNSNYKTLKKGEYVNFDIVAGDNGQQAVNVTGIGGGSLICDVNPYHRIYPTTRKPYEAPVRSYAIPIIAPPPPPAPRGTPQYPMGCYAMQGMPRQPYTYGGGEQHVRPGMPIPMTNRFAVAAGVPPTQYSAGTRMPKGNSAFHRAVANLPPPQ